MRLSTALPVVALVLLSTSGAEAKRARIPKLDPTKCGRSVGAWNPCFVPPNQVVYLSHKQLDALIAVERAKKGGATR